MAKKQELILEEDVVEGNEGMEDVIEEVKPVDYSTYTQEQVLDAIGKAYKAKDMKLMGALSKLYTKKEGEAEKAKKDALLAELVTKTELAKGIFGLVASILAGEGDKEEAIGRLEDKLLAVNEGDFDGAEGFWYAKDFGENVSMCRLTKGAKKAASEGGSGKSSYVANPAKSADLLAQVGGNVYFKEDTLVTIDKVEQTMPAGMTFKDAYDLSTNGGWRNRVRMALLKEAGII